MLSDVIPLWNLEKITRQYLGFNDLVIKEYHDTLTLQVHPYSDSNMIYSKKFNEPVFQWRIKLNIERFPYIYNTRIYFDTALSREQLIEKIRSKEYMILREAVRFK